MNRQALNDRENLLARFPEDPEFLYDPEELFQQLDEVLQRWKEHPATLDTVGFVPYFRLVIFSRLRYIADKIGPMYDLLEAVGKLRAVRRFSWCFSWDKIEAVLAAYDALPPRRAIAVPMPWRGHPSAEVLRAYVQGLLNEGTPNPELVELLLRAADLAQPGGSDLPGSVELEYLPGICPDRAVEVYKESLNEPTFGQVTQDKAWLNSVLVGLTEYIQAQVPALCYLSQKAGDFKDSVGNFSPPTRFAALPAQLIATPAGDKWQPAITRLYDGHAMVLGQPHYEVRGFVLIPLSSYSEGLSTQVRALVRSAREAGETNLANLLRRSADEISLAVRLRQAEKAGSIVDL